MPYVTRNADGAINGLFEQHQEGVAEEYIGEDAAEVLAFLSKPAAVVSVSARQFRLMLRRSGLLDQVKAWVAQQDGETQDAFEYSGTFVKDSAMMMAGFAAMGSSPAEIDAFFQAAAAL